MAVQLESSGLNVNYVLGLTVQANQRLSSNNNGPDTMLCNSNIFYESESESDFLSQQSLNNHLVISERQ